MGQQGKKVKMAATTIKLKQGKHKVTAAIFYNTSIQNKSKKCIVKGVSKASMRWFD